MKLKKNNTKNKYIVKKAFFHKMLFENPVPFTMCSQITTQPNVKLMAAIFTKPIWQNCTGSKCSPHPC